MSMCEHCAMRGGAYALAAVIALVAGTAYAEDDWRWRLFDQGDEALLAIANNDSPGDAFGLPMLSCRQKSNNVIVEGEAKENLRIAMADLIRTDETPTVKVQPAAESDIGTLDLFFSFIDGWRYKFNLRADHDAFARFGREGVIDFKVGTANVHEEYKVGLENIGRFLDLCRAQGR